MLRFLYFTLTILLVLSFVNLNDAYNRMMKRLTSRKVASTLLSLSLPFMTMNNAHAVVQDDVGISRLAAVSTSLKSFALRSPAAAPTA